MPVAKALGETNPSSGRLIESYAWSRKTCQRVVGWPFAGLHGVVVLSHQYSVQAKGRTGGSDGAAVSAPPVSPFFVLPSHSRVVTSFVSIWRHLPCAHQGQDRPAGGREREAVGKFESYVGTSVRRGSSSTTGIVNGTRCSSFVNRPAASLIAAAAGFLVMFSATAQGADPYADEVMSYVAGSGSASPFDNPQVTLGSPERFTGEGIFPSAVTPFNPAFGTNEIVSLRGGGELVLRFDEPIFNDAANPFGIDFIVFGNSFFVDSDYPNAVVGGLFSATSAGRVDVSQDGLRWIEVNGARPDRLFPTAGYSDLSDAYSLVAGLVESDFTKPVDPSFDPMGLSYTQVLAAYAGSGGGAGVDFGPTGLASISYVRVRNAGTSEVVQIDGVSDVSVPAPGAALIVMITGGCAMLIRRRSVLKSR